MRFTRIFWPLFLSLAVHGGLFFLDFSPDQKREEIRNTPPSISLKLVTSLRVRQPEPEPIIKTTPLAAVKPPEEKPAPPLKQVGPKPEPRAKTVQNKSISPEKKKSVRKENPSVLKRPAEPEPEPRLAETEAARVDLPPASSISEREPTPILPRPEREVDPAPTALASAPSLPEAEEIWVPARIIGSVRPVYPRYSRRHNQEGAVVLKVEISSTGEQTKITIISSSGYARLDRAAIRTLEQASFSPARQGGREVASTKQITVAFKLEEAGK